jgi:hypothetical protein
VSIWIGRKTQQDRRWLWYVVPLNVVAAIVVPSFLAAAYVGASFGFLNNYNDYRGSSSQYNPPSNGLMLNGNAITNIYPFDAQGKQVPVRLYDQDGNPISLEQQDCATNYGTQSRDATSNLFPQAVVVPDENGDAGPDNCKDTTKAPFVPPPAPATRTTPPPTAQTPTPKPSAITPKPSTPATPRPGATVTVEPTR